MRYVAAALLTALGGGEVSEKNLKNLLDAVGIDCDDEKAKIVVEQLKGKSIEELLAEGTFDLTIFWKFVINITASYFSRYTYKMLLFWSVF